MPYKPLMSTFEGKTHLRTGKQIQDKAPVVILQLSWCSSPPCGHTLVLTKLLLLKTPQRFTTHAPPAVMLPPSALTPTPHAVRMNLASPPSSRSTSQNTHFMQKGIRMQTSSPRFNLLRSWAPFAEFTCYEILNAAHLY